MSTLYIHLVLVCSRTALLAAGFRSTLDTSHLGDVQEGCMAKKKVKKAKAWKYQFIVQPFNWTLNLVTPSCLDEFRKLRLKAGDDSVEVERIYCSIRDDLESGGACCGSFSGGGKMTVALPDEFDYTLAYHEAFHCATLLWDHAGANLAVPDNDEVLTYTADHVVREIKKVYDTLIAPVETEDGNQ